MRYFETVESEYYALIKAETEEEAVSLYIKEVAENFPVFREVTVSYVVGKFFSRVMFKGSKQVIDEESEQFSKDVGSDSSMVLLVDASLL